MITNLVGIRIRSLRAQRKLTQKQLADLAGIPRATLATVERDDANPSLAVVFKIANALGMTVDQLIESAQRKIQHWPSRTMGVVESGDRAYRAVTISPLSAFHITQLIFSLVPGGSYEGKPHPPGSEEYLHVLEGNMVLEVAGESMAMGTMDTACFQGNVRHFYRNPHEVGAVGLVTILEGVRGEKIEGDE
ncbi:MAG: helix-turn-helix transcriptional regulator [Magnetococcales bacterium]|nr:helix-turn-helix transcriptional regulator [Magnetococcales bacterium]MBF0149917.1 helix-turn-helix transcriptional regulator [Magnetococcales bacterium]MBF0172914.1 helix-turn-helix transcriptional regulator [Magnetococcales bacterium]MBF0630427.1 helix-turn-helix transcriptional regulator [Magnetococcales bacterium]